MWSSKIGGVEKALRSQEGKEGESYTIKAILMQTIRVLINFP